LVTGVAEQQIDVEHAKVEETANDEGRQLTSAVVKFFT
jgi:hypothetical protein